MESTKEIFNSQSTPYAQIGKPAYLKYTFAGLIGNMNFCQKGLTLELQYEIAIHTFTFNM